MATILAVDDRAINRQLLATLLGYKGYRVIEAGDGREALDLLKHERPDLIITDIMMPNMDGAELATAIRADEKLASLPIVFYTATYRAREARILADDCGANLVLTKPTAPETILQVVETLLKSAAPPTDEDVDSARTVQNQTDGTGYGNIESLRLLTHLAAVIELGLDASSIREPERLFLMFGRATQDILAAKLAGIAVLDATGNGIGHCFVKSRKHERAIWYERQAPQRGPIAQLLKDGRPQMMTNPGGNPRRLGLPASHPRVSSLLAVPIQALDSIRGWLYVADPIDGREFDQTDERLSATIASQLGLIYENILLSRELEHTAAELAQRHSELESFAYSISHDLKEPLREVQLLSAFLREDYSASLDDRGRGYIDSLTDTSAHAQRLIADVLALARLSLDGPAAVQHCDTAQLLDETVLRLRLEIERRDATVAIREGLPHVAVDPSRVEQIFQNLISNAIKFVAGRTPRVEIGLRSADHNEAVIYVQDNGIGIDERYHQQIFGLFERLHTREQYEGTGAGLAIVKRATEVSGGRVWIESEPGAGATFLVALPIAKQASTELRPDVEAA